MTSPTDELYELRFRHEELKLRVEALESRLANYEEVMELLVQNAESSANAIQSHNRIFVQVAKRLGVPLPPEALEE